MRDKIIEELEPNIKESNRYFGNENTVSELRIQSKI